MSSASRSRSRRCARRPPHCSSASTRPSGTRTSGFYAYMLDGEKRKVLTVASNPGHLLWSGIVPPDRAARVVARLMAPDMNSGLGHPHAVGAASRLQSVFVSEWLGLAARQQPDRARLQTLRLRARGRTDRPRHQRRREPLPAQPVAGTLRRRAARRGRVPGAVSRRQRAAGLGRRLGASRCCRRSSAFVRTRRADASSSIPTLPAWLPDITLYDIRLGQRSFDVRFWRDDETTHFEVLRGAAHVVEHRPFDPLPT